MAACFQTQFKLETFLLLSIRENVYVLNEGMEKSKILLLLVQKLRCACAFLYLTKAPLRLQDLFIPYYKPHQISTLFSVIGLIDFATTSTCMYVVCTIIAREPSLVESLSSAVFESHSQCDAEEPYWSRLHSVLPPQKGY